MTKITLLASRHCPKCTKNVGNQGICPEIWVVFETSARRMTGYAEILFWFKPNTLAQHFYWMYKRAGVDSASSHSGRKTFCSSLASQGISPYVIASLAGHRSIQTTMRYVTCNDEIKRKAVELV